MSAPRVRCVMRLARPVSDLARTVEMYRRGLGLHELGRFVDHAGFDGVMLGMPGNACHFEFTICRAHPLTPCPTPEDLIVFYIPEPANWRRMCDDMSAAGFEVVASFNPYWEALGRTFADPDGYRIVLQRDHWQTG